LEVRDYAHFQRPNKALHPDVALPGSQATHHALQSINSSLLFKDFKPEILVLLQQFGYQHLQAGLLLAIRAGRVLRRKSAHGSRRINDSVLMRIHFELLSGK
jgi:hypothetical protein